MTVSRRIQIDDVVGFLRGLGIKGVKDGPEVAFCCPFHGDNDPSASMNKMTTAWFCHGCHEKGNAYTLATKMGGDSPYLSMRPHDDDDLLAYVHEMTREDSEEPPLHQEEEEEGPIDGAHLDMFKLDWRQELINDSHLWNTMDLRFGIWNPGSIEKLLDHYSIGYDPYSKRITIPMVDWRGLWGFKARALGKTQPRYLALGGHPYGFKPFKSGSLMFNYHPPGETLWIVEGEFNAIVVDWWFGNVPEQRVAGLSGSVLTRKQIEIVKAHRPKRVVLYFDDDLPGATGAWHAYQELSPHVPVYTVGPHDKDACDSNEIELEQTLGDIQDPLVRVIGDPTWAKVSAKH